MIRCAWIGLLALAACEGPNVDLSTQSRDGGGATAPDLALGGLDGDAGAGSGGDGGGPLPPGVSPEVGPYADFVKVRAHAECSWLVRCGEVGASEVGDCESAAIASVSSAPPPYSVDDGIAAGRAALDPGATRACIDALDAAGCGARDLDTVKAACLAVVKGSVPTGLGCRADFECTAGYCANVALGCGAICRPFASAGFACTSAPCDSSSYCDRGSGRCVAVGVLNSACDRSRPCGAALVCRGLTGAASGQCGAVAKAGEACASSEECALGLYCASATLKCSARLDAGAQCTDADACAGGKSCVGLAYPKGASVGKPGTCAAFLDVGAACDPTVDDSGCPADTLCGKTSKRCEAVGTAGAACPPGGCRDGLYCDSHGLCQPLVAYGGGCVPDAAVSSGPCRFGACDASARACLTSCP